MIKSENIAFAEMGSGAAQIQRIEFDRSIWEDVSGGFPAIPPQVIDQVELVLERLAMGPKAHNSYWL
jgi:hypothetical protein